MNSSKRVLLSGMDNGTPGMAKVAVILPSRGLMFSKTAEDILHNVKHVEHKFFFSHGKPIPDCFEDPTVEALKDKTITHLWFVEDDMIIPPSVLYELLKADVHAIACDYPTTREGQGAAFVLPNGKTVFTGTGCLLVKREVFDKLKRPYFTDKIRWNVLNYKNHIKFLAQTRKAKFMAYGLHDVTFGVRLYMMDMPIVLSPVKLAQRKLVELGKAGSNDGSHKIEEWREFTPNYLYNKIRAQDPMPEGDLVCVQTPTGEVMTDKAHAEKLVKAGLGEIPENRHLVIDDPEELL